MAELVGSSSSIRRTGLKALARAGIDGTGGGAGGTVIEVRTQWPLLMFMYSTFQLRFTGMTPHTEPPLARLLSNMLPDTPPLLVESSVQKYERQLEPLGGVVLTPSPL
jgi:hypothetical protein